jgi:D-alanyl-D-alanine carboxypeptidase (penicillin-binding protein 5/6)
LDYGSPGTKVGTLIEPDPSLVAPKPDDVAAAQVAAIVPHADILPVRVGVAVIGTIIVLGPIMAARLLNRRPQH